MNMSKSKHVDFFFKNGKPAQFYNCGAHELELEKALPIIQDVYDILSDKGLCYMHCRLITDIVMQELSDKRDRSPL